MTIFRACLSQVVAKSTGRLCCRLRLKIVSQSIRMYIYVHCHSRLLVSFKFVANVTLRIIFAVV